MLSMRIPPSTRRPLTSIAALSLALAAAPAAAQSGQVSFAVTDTVSRVVRRIAPDLRLEIAAEGFPGWEVGVYAVGDPTRENLLYHSREWHGPYPTQVSAWAEARDYFGPGVRVLPVRGRRWVVRVECARCVTSGAGDSARFTAGTLRVSWRRVHR